MLLEPTTRGRIERVRSLRRRMSFETFERTIPFRPGWKREYYGGMARVRPSWTMVSFALELTARPLCPTPGLRSVTEADAPAIRDAFLDSFRFAPEYVDYSMAGFRKQAGKYVSGFFGEARGRRSPASVLVERAGRVLAAALVKEADGKAPLLDCVFVRPECFRQGLATAATREAVNRLADSGHHRLRSHAMLANESSQAWHSAFGFAEVPDYFVAQSRFYSTRNELERLKDLGALDEDERKRLEALAGRWEEELTRLENLPRAERFPEF